MTELNFVNNLRFLSVLAVVFLHCSAQIFISANKGGFDWWVSNIFDSSVRWSVPVFVMLSGALLLSKNHNDLKSEVVNKV